MCNCDVSFLNINIWGSIFTHCTQLDKVAIRVEFLQRKARLAMKEKVEGHLRRNSFADLKSTVGLLCALIPTIQQSKIHNNDLVSYLNSKENINGSNNVVVLGKYGTRSVNHRIWCTALLPKMNNCVRFELLKCF